MPSGFGGHFILNPFNRIENMSTSDCYLSLLFTSESPHLRWSIQLVISDQQI
jgi:hypothetical protein